MDDSTQDSTSGSQPQGSFSHQGAPSLALSGNRFCTVCGRVSGRLHVHDIEGYRNVAFDDLSTVVTVCPRHHVLLERWTQKIVRLSAPLRRDLALVIAGHLWERQQLLLGLALRRKGGAA